MNAPITNWEGQRVWLLGASSGIGAALASALMARGARVALSARRPSPLLGVAAGSGSKTETLVLPCDASDEASLTAAWKRLLGRWGGVDVAVYVAGDYAPTAASALTMADARRIVEVNLLGAMAFSTLVVPQLLADGRGQIGFVGSIAGYRGLPNAGAYGPSKAGLINFVEALALELMPQAVGVRLINPGFVATPLTAKNRFRMPALLSSEEAASAIIEGFRSTAFEIHFPRRFSWTMKFLSLLPARLYFPLVRQLTGSGSKGARND